MAGPDWSGMRRSQTTTSYRAKLRRDKIASQANTQKDDNNETEPVVIAWVRIQPIHGDYRLDNTMLGDDGRIKAVLDWEICTLGDPLADVGLLMVYWADPGDNTPALLVAPTALPGFPRRADMAKRYSERAGRDVSALDFYIAFGYWKLACILEGVYARYAGGAMGGDRSGFEGFSQQVLRLAEAARDAASRL